MIALNTPTYMRLRDQMRTDIVSGIWALGSHVTLAELSKHYQVSANPVREALLQLQGEGVVSMRMNRGAVVPLVDEKYIEDLYRLRGAIQVMLIRDAACHATPDQVAQMMVYCEAYEAAALTDDIGDSVKANRALHHCIDGISGNLMAVQLLEGRSSLVDAFRRHVGYGVGRQKTVAKQHRKLVNAIAAGDEEAAALASLEHTDSSRIDLVAACRATKSVIAT